MINLNKAELRDKIYACWLGKNIGGTIGTPFECQRQANNCTGFTSKKGEPLPKISMQKTVFTQSLPARDISTLFLYL